MTDNVHTLACGARLAALLLCTCDSGAEGPVAEAMNGVPATELRTVSDYWTCIVCKERHPSQLVRMYWYGGRWIGKSCLHHGRNEGWEALGVKCGT